MSPSQSPRTAGTTTPHRQRSSRADHARRVADVLRAEVLSGRLALGMLPPESHLAGEYGVSRNAVRAALDLLRSEGLVERIPGTGSRTRDSILPHGIDNLLGLAEAFGGRGEVRNEVLLSTTLPAPRAVAERLQLEPGGNVVCLERRRFLGGRPLSLDLTFVVPDLGVRLLEHDLSTQRLGHTGAPEWQVRVGAVRALVAAPADGAVPTVVRALEDVNADVRKAAVLVLSEWTGHPGVTEALEPATKDQDADVRGYARRALSGR